MNITDRLLLSIVTASVLILGIFQAARSQPYPYELCEEVGHELNNAYVEGIITRSEAEEILDNCFEHAASPRPQRP